MTRPPLEVADIFRQAGAAWRRAHAGHLSRGQLKARSAIEQCRTHGLGGHVLHCEPGDKELIAYNSCRNRHCPKCQRSAAKRWLADRQAELLPVEYSHGVFTLPAPIAEIAYQNKAILYDLLFKASAETLTTIAADPKHRGAKIGFTSILHPWGSALTHHPHVHCLVPGGGLSPDGERFRRRFLEKLHLAHESGRLQFFGPHQRLAHRARFAEFLTPLSQIDWGVYAKRPFAGPQAVLAYRSRYTHRVAISNRRLRAHDERGVTFTWKDYRTRRGVRYKPMPLATDEFIRRFLIPILPKGFRRIRHDGLFASHLRRGQLARIQRCLKLQEDCQHSETSADDDVPACPFVCRTCGTPMRIVDTVNPSTQAPP